MPPPQAYAAPSFPPHFAPPLHGAPVATTARSTGIPPRMRASAFPAEVDPPPATPAAVMAASMFLGVPLALATLIVAVLALR